MKQILLSFLLLLATTACEKASINGKLDGRWQLMSISYANGTTENCDRIYYSIQLHLIEISNKGNNPCTFIGRFSYKDNEVTISEFRNRGNEQEFASLSELSQFGLNRPITTFLVEKVTSKQLILKSDYATLTFRKF